MHDYKKLIDNLRYWAAGCDRTNRGCQVCLYLYEAADAIEQLVNDRNASIDALKAIEDAICNYGGLKGGDE